ncbi:hypothetical protein PWG14_27670 [Chromobacterium amazonense]|uniref:hypothetical protein n=1 Tax=Chromobacterium amazonense TaxID=1382803 RepID=UPI00237E930A|nr:hypothetical protein [Chromobacterium amazonense]MDE1716249.1 hypothetical protein [Chromobacterium amazonense]
MDKNQMQMRSVLIYGTEGEILLNSLSQVPGWELMPLGIVGGHEHCLSNGNEKVALHIIAPNVVSTSNVLPHDWEHNQASANELLKKLSKALTDAGIENIISASESDLA